MEIILQDPESKARFRIQVKLYSYESVVSLRIFFSPCSLHEKGVFQ